MNRLKVLQRDDWIRDYISELLRCYHTDKFKFLYVV